MKLIIKNLGPIKNNTQAIDLSKDFLVFVGHNNSGKTYVSQLLWAIYNEKSILKFTLSNLSEYSEKLDLYIKNGKVEINESLVNEILTNYQIFIEKEVRDIFNIQNDQSFELSIQINSELSELNSLIVKERLLTRIDEELKLCEIKKNKDSLELSIAFKEIPEDLKDKSILATLRQENKTSLIGIGSNFTNIKIGLFLIIVDFIITRRNNYKTLFLPSSRHFYPIFYRYIYEVERKKDNDNITLNDLLNLAIQEDTLRKTRKDKEIKRPYTEPISQLFEKLYSLNESISEGESYLYLLQKLHDLMGGGINLGSFEGIAPIEFYFKLNDNKTNLPMYLTSSSVSQLTLLYLYFKYWVEEENNFLIIDEPEENLDPENQIKLLEILIEFAMQNNNKVLFTTHSPLLADAVNNCIYLDVLKNEMDFTVKKIEEIIEENNLQYLNPSVSLSKDNIGVYFFTGKKLIDYQADDYGVSFSNFRKVQNNLDKSARILTDYIYLGDEPEDE